MKKDILKWCEYNGIATENLTEWQLRLKTAKRECDLYFRKNVDHKAKYHVIKHPDNDIIQKRGDVPQKEVINLLESIFN